VIRTQKGVAWHSKKCSEFAARVHRVLLSCHVPLLTTAAPCRPPLHSVSGSRRSLHLAGQAIANDQPPTCLAGQSPGASVPGRRCSAREPGGAVGRGHGPRARRPPPPPRVARTRATCASSRGLLVLYQHYSRGTGCVLHAHRARSVLALVQSVECTSEARRRTARAADFPTRTRGMWRLLSPPPGSS
jgi:hypothetical protein